MTQDTFTTRPSDLLMRLTDIVISLVLLPFFLPVLLVVTFLILREDGKPVFFRQTRIGRGCQPFDMLKFRTMRHDPARASGAVAEGADLKSARAQFQTASKSDNRITVTGRILRSTHLDELPQLLNVLKGDMSLVGVRPDVPVQQADYTPEEWEMRHRLRPGITGLAQTDPGGTTAPGSRTRLDLEWVRTRSFGLYVKILLRTFRNVQGRKGI
ncbi:sugar transferase [Roseobacter ponti]|uniref:Sugar transferase n=1 Tax=Roseobacter ponti TaxID=1891787 RepID=A0A858SW11_9RHOB|nr:sugar transferase [Roseobacter ponti]QJF52885.1 sugar transferase [Roseobacter ponti]